MALERSMEHSVSNVTVSHLTEMNLVNDQTGLSQNPSMTILGNEPSQVELTNINQDHSQSQLMLLDDAADGVILPPRGLNRNLQQANANTIPNNTNNVKAFHAGGTGGPPEHDSINKI